MCLSPSPECLQVFHVFIWSRSRNEIWEKDELSYFWLSGPSPLYQPLCVALQCSCLECLKWRSKAIKVVSAIATIMIMELSRKTLRIMLREFQPPRPRGEMPRQPQQHTSRLQAEPHADLSPQKNAPPHCTYSLNPSINLCPGLYSFFPFPKRFSHFSTHIQYGVYCRVNVQSIKFKSPTSSVPTGDPCTSFGPRSVYGQDSVGIIG